MLANHRIRNWNKLAMATLGALYLGFKTDARPPLVFAHRLIAAPPAPLALKPQGKNIVPSRKQFFEQLDFFYFRRVGMDSTSRDWNFFGNCDRLHPLDFSDQFRTPPFKFLQILPQHFNLSKTFIHDKKGQSKVTIVTLDCTSIECREFGE
jgi:hypothetical protein